MFHSRVPAMFAVLALAALGGCDESDLGSLRIKLNNDFSGQATIVTLGARAQPGAAGTESGSVVGGVKWDTAATVVTQRGSFQRLSDVKFGDIQFAVDHTVSGECFASIMLPRGPQVKWLGLLTVTASADLQRVNAALSPENAKAVLGKSVKLEITLPAKPVSSGISATGPTISPATDDLTVTLLLPVDVVLEDGPPIIWHMTWEPLSAGH